MKGQQTEFKECFPEQGHSLCTEVAAFATSGGGTLLLGVTDNAKIAGLDGDTEKKRDDLILRAQNLIAVVNPPVTYQIYFGHPGGCVLAIVIEENQKEPVYYYQSRPYVRDRRISRPATPDEVKALVWSHPSADGARRTEELKLRIAEDHHEAMKRTRDR